MSHLNAEKAVASQIKSLAGAEAAKMMESGMEKMDMGAMMMEGMSKGMGPMMMGNMGPMMMEEGMGAMMRTPGVASGVIVYAGAGAGKSVVRKIFTHPLVLFGLGVVAGCYVYKYRKCFSSTCVKSEG